MTIYDCKMTWEELLISPWFWVPAFFVASLGSKRWMPLYATLMIIVATMWWEQMLNDVVLWVSR